MKNLSLRTLLAGSSFVALLLASGSMPARADSVVWLDTSVAIDGPGTNTVMTDSTNPNLRVTNGTATTPVFTTSGTNNHIVTIGGVFVADTGNDAIIVTGNNSHGASDMTTNVTLAGQASNAGSGTAFVYHSTGTYNYLTLLTDAVLTGGTGVNDVGLLFNTSGSSNGLTLANNGDIFGHVASGRSAIGVASTNTGNVEIVNSVHGVIESAGIGAAINLEAGAANYNAIIENNGTIHAYAGSAIVLTNGADTANSITVAGGAVYTQSSVNAAIDTSGVTNGYTTITLTGGQINGGGAADGTAIKFGLAGDKVDVSGSGHIVGKVLTATGGVGRVNLSSGSGFLTRGDFGSSTEALGRVSILGGTATIEHNLYADELYFSVGTATLNASVAAGTTSMVFDAGTLNLKTNTFTVGTGSTLGGTDSDGTVALTIGASANGKIVSAGTLSNILTSDGVTLEIAPTVSGRTVVSGDKFVIVKGTTHYDNFVLTGVTNTLFSSWDFAAAIDGTDAYGNAITGNNVVLEYTTNTSSGLGLRPNQANAVDAGISSGAPSGVSSALNALTTGAQAAVAGDELRSETSRGSIEGALAASQGAFSTIETRLDGFRSGVNTGDETVGAGAWIQGFGFTGVQGARYDANGYKAKAGGVTFGVDKEITKAVRLGAAFTYGGTSVDETGVNTGNTTEIKSYQGTLYASYQGAPWYVNGAFNAGIHKYDTVRDIDFTGFSDMASAEHDGFLYSFKADGGYPINVSGFTVTPTVGFAYAHLDQDAYTETSASGAALSVGELTSKSMKSSLGGKVAKTFSGENYKLTPELRAAWVHEFEDKSLTSTASYVDGGSSFTTTQAKPEANSAIVGAGVTLKTIDNFSLTAGYNAELRKKYVGHTGSLQVRVDF